MIEAAWFRQKLRFLPITLVVMGTLCTFLFVQAGRFVSSPADLPVHADLIVVLGGEPHRRPIRAAELFKAGYAPRIFLAGNIDFRSTFLQNQGIPSTAIIMDGKSRHSWDEAMNTYELMQANGWKRVLVVSDPPHLRRLQWTWTQVLAGSSIGFSLIPARLEGWDAAHWWQNPAYAWYVRRELLKLVVYMLIHGGDGAQYRIPELISH